ncbi:MAG: response regulator [Desulfobulbaceae bacterium]|nr:response regulator [Desulfobulbaceae bacterium]
MNSAEKSEPQEIIKVLIVDDSLVFRRFLGDILNDCDHIKIAGEAQNGIEALDLILKLSPDVILLDMEMPLMDGMTALQHLMIHRPTPTIMFSSLSEEGTARCFDTLKNGAVDFLCKDFIFQKNNLATQRGLIADKVDRAAKMIVKAREPIPTVTKVLEPEVEPEERVIFCEECGNRQAVVIERAQPVYNFKCTNCGDIIDLGITSQAQYRRNNFVTVLAGGNGAYFNLLEIVPYLQADIGGTIIALINGETDHINSFAEYLDSISSMKVIRACEGTNIEAGNCYIVSGADCMSIKPFSTQLTLQKVAIGTLKGGAVDVILASVSTIFKKRASAVILSGDEDEGEKGVAILMKNGGLLEVLAAEECYSKNLGKSITEKLKYLKRSSTKQVIEAIEKNHLDAKY